jgi:glycosyltransferase involved in cell wall biosynthesis
MKSVIHVGTSDIAGGAAIAAWRLHEGLKLLGADSRVVCVHRSSSSPDVSQISTPLLHALDLFHRQRVEPAQPDGATYFSVSPVSVSLLDHPWIAAADVVHFHWVARFLAPEDIAALFAAGKTVFWTFHDQWAYTGGCHYIGGTTRTPADWDGSAQIGSSMHSIVAREFQRKMDAFKDQPIHVIAPSRWMAEEAAQSGVFARDRIRIVPYGIDTSVFRPTPDRGADVPDEKVGLLFGCQSLEDRRKGFRELRQALALCMRDEFFADAVAGGRITLTTFGHFSGMQSYMPIPVQHLGTLERETDVAAALHAASCFICPTLEDNLPNVVMEALACGCPVVAFSTGGVPDMVEHARNGLLAPKGDVSGLARCILEFCKNQGLRESLETSARSADLGPFALETQASTMRELYQAAAGESGGSMGPDPLPVQNVRAKLIPDFATEIAEVLLEENAGENLQHAAAAAELRWQLARAHELTAEALRETGETKERLRLEEIAAAGFRDALHGLRSRYTGAKGKLLELRNRLQSQERANRRLKELSDRRTIRGRFRRLFRRMVGKK